MKESKKLRELNFILLAILLPTVVINLFGEKPIQFLEEMSSSFTALLLPYLYR
jgi:hypothetical protein